MTTQATADDAGTERDERPDEPQLGHLVLVRHGESQVTVDRVIGGHRTCTGLSDLGRRQAERLRARLAETAELGDSVLISSAFPRAIETAEAIAASIGDAAPIIEPGFGEHDPGPELDGITFDEYVERFGSPDWGGGPHVDVFPGGGETIGRFHVRVGEALTKVLKESPGQRIVVACHGGVIDAIFRLLLKTAQTGTFDLWTLNTSITEFRETTRPGAIEPRWRLVRYNDAAHLAGLPDATPRSS